MEEEKSVVLCLKSMCDSVHKVLGAYQHSTQLHLDTLERYV